MKYQKITTTVINNVLAFMQPFASKTLLRAVEVLLLPCCDLVGTVEVECENDGDYIVTITTDPTIGFLGKGTATVTVNGYSYVGTITEPNTIVATNVDPGAGTYDVGVVVFLPTNTDSNIGVYKSFTIEDVVFPAC